MQVGVALSQRPVVRGRASPPRLVSLILHVGTMTPPSLTLLPGSDLTWCGLDTAVFGQSVLFFDVVMEEVCCKFVHCRRRASSVTLPIPWSKMVSLDNQKFEYVLGQSR